MASCKALSETVLPVGALASLFSNVAMSALRAASQVASLHAAILELSDVASGGATGGATGVVACWAIVALVISAIKPSDAI